MCRHLMQDIGDTGHWRALEGIGGHWRALGGHWGQTTYTHYPNTKMNENNDSIPYEKQWCKG